MVYPKQTDVSITATAITPDLKNTEANRCAVIEMKYRNVSGLKIRGGLLSSL